MFIRSVSKVIASVIHRILYDFMIQRCHRYHNLINLIHFHAVHWAFMMNGDRNFMEIIMI